MLYIPTKLDIAKDVKHAEVLNLPFPIDLVGKTFELGGKAYVISDRFAIVPTGDNTTSIYSLIKVTDKVGFLKSVLGYALTAWNNKDDSTLGVSFSKKYNAKGLWESADIAGLMVLISAIFEKFADNLIEEGAADLESAKANAARAAQLEATRARTVSALTPEAVAEMYTTIAANEAAKAKADADAANEGITIETTDAKINIRVAPNDSTQNS